MTEKRMGTMLTLRYRKRSTDAPFTVVLSGEELCDLDREDVERLIDECLLALWMQKDDTRPRKRFNKEMIE